MTAALSVHTSTTTRALTVIREQIEGGIAAKKCHGCGCFQQTVTALSATQLGAMELAPALATAKDTFTPKKYDCLGCAVCFPAIAANAFTEAFPGAGEVMDLCPTEEPVERAGWPPLPGDFEVVRYGAPVAVCTLNSNELMRAMSRAAPDGLAIVGTMHTENLGIERLIQNVMANPNIRFLVLCGEDTQQAIGHLPGQSLASLIENGIDPAGLIVGAGGKRPVMKNMTREMVQAFRDQIELVPLLGETDIARISAVVDECARRSPAPHVAEASRVTVETVQARAPKRLIPDPAGYFIVYPERRTRSLSVEHFTNAGVLDVVIDGETPAAVYATIIERGIITRLDHAAYLGRELARAARSIETGEQYVQDRAPGEIDDPPPMTASCGCSKPCRSIGSPGTELEMTSDAAATSTKRAAACALEGRDLAARIEEWRSMLASVTERTPIDRGLRLRLSPATDVRALADLVSREVTCCAFFEIALHVAKDALTLEVRAPENAQEVLLLVFGDGDIERAPATTGAPTMTACSSPCGTGVAR